jgi:hypothetical protein
MESAAEYRLAESRNGAYSVRVCGGSEPEAGGSHRRVKGEVVIWLVARAARLVDQGSRSGCWRWLKVGVGSRKGVAG